MSVEGDVFGHQFSLDMQDGLPLGLGVDPIQGSDDEEVHCVLNLNHNTA